MTCTCLRHGPKTYYRSVGQPSSHRALPGFVSVVGRHYPHPHPQTHTHTHTHTHGTHVIPLPPLTEGRRWRLSVILHSTVHRGQTYIVERSHRIYHGAWNVSPCSRLHSNGGPHTPEPSAVTAKNSPFVHGADRILSALCQCCSGEHDWGVRTSATGG